MKIKTGSKSALLLMEITVVVLVFAISSAVFVRIFASAQQASLYSENLSIAVQKAQTAAELYKQYGLTERMAGELGAQCRTERLTDGAETLRLLYDVRWEPVASEADAAFALTVTPSSELSAAVSVRELSGDGALYELAVGRLDRTDENGGARHD